MGIDKLDKDTDFQWHAGQADVPGLSASEMKAFMDAPVHTLVDKVNEVIGEGEAVDLSTLRQELENHSTAIDNLNTQQGNHSTAIDNLSAQQENHSTAIDNLNTQQKNHSDAINELSTQQGNHSTAIDNLSAQQENHSTAIDNLNTQQEEQNAAISELSAQQESHSTAINELIAQQDSHSTAINELSAQQASTAPVFIDHFDLTVEEITNIYSECILKDRALIIKEGSSKYACTQVYANGTGDQIAFIYTKCSSSGVVTFNRHGYVMKSGMHYPTVYTLQAQG